MSKLLYEDLTYRIIGAAQEVYKELGYGYLESVYEDALCHELSLMNINYLKTTGLRVGLLFNFGAEKFEMLRRIF